MSKNMDFPDVEHVFRERVRTHTGGKMNKVHANIASAICKGPAKEAKNKSMLLRPQKC